jgi:hypothetical protein
MSDRSGACARWPSPAFHGKYEVLSNVRHPRLRAVPCSCVDVEVRLRSPIPCRWLDPDRPEVLNSKGKRRIVGAY